MYMHHCAYVFYIIVSHLLLSFFFFFNDTATTEIYTLSLHDALPIWALPERRDDRRALLGGEAVRLEQFRDLRSEEHTSELQSPCNLVCRLLLEKKKKTTKVIKILLYLLDTCNGCILVDDGLLP